MSETIEIRGTSRLVGIDLARFFAIIAMYVAHVAPSDGPAGVLNLREFLAAPLFAFLLGASTYLSAQKMSFPILFASSVVRGLILIIVGEYISGWGANIDIVLQVLGLLGILAVPLAMLPSWVLGIIALASWYFTLPVRDYFLPLVPVADARNEYFGLGVMWLFTGQHYRVFTMLCWAALGIILVRLMPQWKVAGDVAAFLVTGTAVAAILWYTRPTASLLVYSGDRWEVGFNALLCICVASFCSILARIFTHRAAVLEPLVSVGRMSLSLYVLQIGILALYTRYAPQYGYSANDDSWWMLAALIVLSFVFVLLWKKLLGNTPLYRGPLETALAWTTGRG